MKQKIKVPARLNVLRSRTFGGLRAIRLKAGFSLPAAGAGLLSTDYSQKLKFKLKLKEIKVKV